MAACNWYGPGQAVWQFATTDPIVVHHRSGRFADPVPVLPTASLPVRLLAHLARHLQP
ncbi:hypothetical protein EDD27_8683 [Nonomuraea polychroma]|uniref:Uncharacterized protein n=2 Tax=Nonomuraea polychroma TaxID=46176 RepID=A0A438MK29_9ACTN|nr:hypothetical protein EDD27_8683 [Nonomuraea polychroma]